MKLLKLFPIYTILLSTLIVSCKSTIDKKNFMGTYKIDNIVPLDSVSEFQIRQASNWKLILEDNDNFHLYGTNKNMVGYWRVDFWDNKKKIKGQYSLLLQGGGMLKYAQFDGKNIYFNNPGLFLDSLFSEATFIKKTK